MKERDKLLVITGLFLAFYFLPTDSETVNTAILSGFHLLHDYARHHVLTCLVPAFFIAGAISVFVKKELILRYLGPESKKHVAYLVASVSGSVLTVCSCTILPLFAGIRKRGAGLGPAITFLFSGPAINISAMFLTISVLGPEIGLARIISAILLSILVGISMEVIFREKTEKGGFHLQDSGNHGIDKRYAALFFFSLVMILVVNGLGIDQNLKYGLILLFAVTTGLVAFYKFPREATRQWLAETWNFAKMLLPYLFVGVFIAGFLMPFLPRELIESIVGQNTVAANLVASVFGAFMYFSTLTEIPILQALMAKGMAKGPALALLLAGPSMSLPNMLVVRRVLGTKKTIVYVSLVVLYSTLAGLVFGAL